MVTRTLRSHIVAIIISLGLTAFFVVQHKSSEPFAIFNDLEHLAYDFRLKHTYLEKPSRAPTIIVVDIDDESLAREGRWPWSRQKMAQLTARLHAAGVAVISFDINFSGHEQNPITQLLQQKTIQAQDNAFRQRLQQLTSTVDADQYFVKQLQISHINHHAKTVLGFLLQKTKTPSITPTSLSSSPIIVVNNHSPASISSIQTAGYLTSLKQFQQAATGNGFLSIRPDSDGALRYTALVMQYQNSFYPSLALETLRVYKNEKNIYLNTIENNNNRTVHYINVGITSIDTNSEGEIMIPYTQAKTAFRTYSATTLLQQDTHFNAQPFVNSIVFIGSSASRLNDLKTTPFSVNYPGVYIQALITQALFEPQRLPIELDWKQKEYGVLYAILIFGLLLSISLAFFNALWLRFMLVSLPFIFLLINFYLWSVERLNIPLIIPLALIVTIITTHLSVKAFHARQEKQQLRSLFDKYVSPVYIKRLLRSPEKLNLEGELREMTVLFADMRNFTSLSEKLRSQQIKHLLNRYFFTPATEAIFEQQGTIDKYVGDMVMAFWNAPLEDKYHAEHAVRAALAMLEKIKHITPQLAAENLPVFEIGIGISTGFMSVGDMGSKHHRSYTVIGDIVNLGARVESLTKTYGLKLLVTEQTKIACRSVDPTIQQQSSPLLFRYVDCVVVKGREKAVKIYEVVVET